MTGFFDEREPDPEVLADLRFRDESERDSSRQRTARYDWRPAEDEPVELWRCRNPKCSRKAMAYREHVDSAAMFDGQLASRDETPLDRSKILYCESCIVEFKRTAPDRRRGQVERMAVVIRKLKESSDPERERAHIEQLREWGHPDVDGLIKCLVEKRAQASGRSGKRRGL